MKFGRQRWQIEVSGLKEAQYGSGTWTRTHNPRAVRLNPGAHFAQTRIASLYSLQFALGAWQTPFINWKPVTQDGQLKREDWGQFAYRHAYEERVKPALQRVHK